MSGSWRWIPAGAENSHGQQTQQPLGTNHHNQRPSEVHLGGGTYLFNPPGSSSQNTVPANTQDHGSGFIDLRRVRLASTGAANANGNSSSQTSHRLPVQPIGPINNLLNPFNTAGPSPFGLPNNQSLLQVNLGWPWQPYSLPTFPQVAQNIPVRHPRILQDIFHER